MNHRLLALYGLKHNPFAPDLPTHAIYVTQRTEQFFWRIEQALVREGGFAIIHGDPGTYGSVHNQSQLLWLPENSSRLGQAMRARLREGVATTG